MTALAEHRTSPCSAPGLIAVSNALADLLERETEALAAMRLKDATALVDEKARLTRHYRAQLEEMRAKRTALPAPRTDQGASPSALGDLVSGRAACTQSFGGTREPPHSLRSWPSANRT